MPTFDSITQIADNIFEDLGRPTDTTLSAIAFWLRNNLGNLNISTNQNYILNQDESVSPNINSDSYGVFAAMYRVRYFEKKYINGLSTAGYDIPTEVTSDGMTVRLESKIALSKFWSEAQKTAQSELNDLINAYKVDKNLPLQVAGDDDQGVSLYVAYDGINSRQVQV
jgi:hypothetical protein